MKRSLVGIFALISLVLAGCGGGDSGGGGTPVDPDVTQTITPAGGDFQFQGGKVGLTVPATAVSTGTVMTVKAATGFPANPRMVAGTAWTLSTPGDTGFFPHSPAVLQLQYSLPEGTDQADLRIGRLSAGSWADMTSTVDLTHHKVRTEVTLPGTYAVFMGPAPTSVTYKAVITSLVEGGTYRHLRGTGELEVANDHSQVIVRLHTFDLPGVSDAELHLAPLGGNGLIAANLYSGANPWTNDFTKVITADRLNPAVVTSMEQFITAIQNGEIYVHIRSADRFAILGWFGEALQTENDLRGSNVVPAVSTTATGHAKCVFSRDMSTVTVTLDVAGFTEPITGAEIHLGKTGINGPAIFPLITSSTTGTTFTVTLEASDFVPGADVTSFDQALGVMMIDGAYISVSTASHPGGEIRGQVRG